MQARKTAVAKPFGEGNRNGSPSLETSKERDRNGTEEWSNASASAEQAGGRTRGFPVPER